MRVSPWLALVWLVRVCPGVTALARPKAARPAAKPRGTQPSRAKGFAAAPAPSPPPPPVGVVGAAAPVSTMDAHMAAVRGSVDAHAIALCEALAADREAGFFSTEAFLGPAAVAAMLLEARSLGATMAASHSTRWDAAAGETVTYAKVGVRATQVLGGVEAYEATPRLVEYVVSVTAALSAALNAGFESRRDAGAYGLPKLDAKRQTNKLAVCDEVGASYAKHVDNGGGGDPRIITVILYLSGADGGELRAFDQEPSGETLVLSPRAGTLVAFWSDGLVHDVAPLRGCDGPEGFRWALTVWLCAADLADVRPTPQQVLDRHFPDALPNST
ncbi:hypothetical protein M885DRAFT_517272 [Pelagophyceae sp. CCMP2097]|nr:hypothetical protein M885DRAFT_517272 [Pelagophyceae sp. CCMP2097]